MVATASGASAFAPAARPRIAVAADGSLAAIVEPTRVTLIEVPSGAVLAEIGVDPDAGACEVAWVGAPPRLVVLSRYAAHSTVHLIDAAGPRTVSEIRLESPMRLYATVGPHALAVGAMGAAVLTAGDAHLTPYQFPARAVPACAGAAAGQFVVALAGAIEEWDPATRMPKRRLKLPRPSVITAVGGSERAVWMTTQQDPTRVDVMPLVNRGQPKWHDLPEPIASVAAHPKSDLIACVGADSGRLYVVDLDGRARLRTITADGVERVEAAGLVVGRMLGVVVAQARRPIAIVAIDADAAAAASVAVPVSLPAMADGGEVGAIGSSSLYGDDDSALPELVSPAPPATPERIVLAPPAPVAGSASVTGSAPVTAASGWPSAAAAAAARPSLFRQPTTPTSASPRAAGASAAPAAPIAPAQSLSERFSLWRDRMRDAKPRDADEAALPWIDPRPSWRDELVAWARGIAAGSIERGAPEAPAIDALVGRFELPAQLAPAIMLLYGAHLGGERGAPPVDVARVLGRRWDEALGRGLLASRGVAVYAKSRVMLAAPIARTLDELPPRTGTLVGEPGPIALLGACCVVADGPLAPIAARCRAGLGGAILVAADDADPAEVLLEARAIGAAAMLRISHHDLDRVPTDAAILVVPDEVTAEALGVPRL
jgi:hypothetical protein